MKAYQIRKYFGSVFLVMLLWLMVACGPSDTTTPAPTESPAAAPTESAPATPLEEAASSEEAELVRVEGGDGPPFYARFGENETFRDGEWVAIIFYRSPDCVPDEFNLNQFFDFPGETGPGAFGCQPPTTHVVEYWAGEPGSSPAPAVSEMTGRGAVPVWFFSAADMDVALADNEVTITELEALPSRRIGSAASYTEYLKPSQSNEAPLIRFSAEGALEDGGNFLVDVSYGDPAVADHTTIDLGP